MMMAAFPESIPTEHQKEAHGPRITLPAESREPGGQPAGPAAAHVCAGPGCAAGTGIVPPGRAGVQDPPRLGRRQFGRGKWQV